MKTLQEYLLNKDTRIKDIVLSFARHKNIDACFKGYYIEENNLKGSSVAKPIYESYEVYREENPYSEINHIRYFFELKKGELQHTLTVHLNGKEYYHVSFSIDELVEGFEDDTPELKLKESDFEQLMIIIKKKFDL